MSAELDYVLGRLHEVHEELAKARWHENRLRRELAEARGLLERVQEDDCVGADLWRAILAFLAGQEEP